MHGPFHLGEAAGFRRELAKPFLVVGPQLRGHAVHQCAGRRYRGPYFGVVANFHDLSFRVGPDSWSRIGYERQAPWRHFLGMDPLWPFLWPLSPLAFGSSLAPWA